MAQFYSQPDYTTQAASTYKGNIDNATTVHHRVAGGLQVAAQSSPDMTIRYTAGSLQNGTTLTEIAAGSYGTITAPSTNPRIDRIVVDNVTGAISAITGAEAGSPTAPAITSGKTALAQIALATSTTQITNSLITDERPSINITTSNDLADLDINGATAETSADDADAIAIYDDTAGANRKMTRANLLAGQAVGNIDIAGATDLATAPADADEFIVNDGGTNKKVSYSDIKSGIGAPVLIKEVAISSSSTVDLQDGVSSVVLDSTYKQYRIEIIGVVPSADGVTMGIQMRSSATWQTTGYHSIVKGLRAGSTTDIETVSTSGSQAQLSDGNTVGNVGGESFNSSVVLFNPADSALKTVIRHDSTYLNQSGEYVHLHGGGGYATAGAVDGIRILCSAVMTSGTVKLYGIN